MALAKTLSEAASYIAQKGIIEESAPAVVRLIASITSRFGIVVSEQVAAKSVPIVGAAAGSIINVMFMDHFQDMARGHFIIRRLETRHGSEMIRDAYTRVAIPI
jgi:predicted outer membrane lipoprotein